MDINHLEVKHDPKAQQFSINIDGKTATLEYRTLEGGTLEYYRTFVPPELRGQKIGEKIVQYAVEYANNNHYKIIPTCSFVKHYIEHHP